jgi:hypothetical protein
LSPETIRAAAHGRAAQSCRGYGRFQSSKLL